MLPSIALLGTLLIGAFFVRGSRQKAQAPQSDYQRWLKKREAARRAAAARDMRGGARPN